MLQQIQETMRQEDMFETKQCSHCGEHKLLNEYHKNKGSSDGLALYCKTCKSNSNKLTNPRNNPRNNPNRMWVNGKYVPQTHPLHKPGRYKNFEQAAFSSLEKYESSVEGQVYVITNPNFPDWVKVGMAVEASDRAKNYQTSSPFRDYKLAYVVSALDRRAVETETHKRLADLFEQRNEWFKCSVAIATRIIDSVIGEQDE